MLNKDAKELVREAVRIFDEDHTPLSGNKCHCGGDVCKEVVGLAFEKFFYSLPKCVKCGRMYLNVHSVTTYGEEEFLKALSTPMTI